MIADPKDVVIGFDFASAVKISSNFIWELICVNLVDVFWPSYRNSCLQCVARLLNKASSALDKVETSCLKDWPNLEIFFLEKYSLQHFERRHLDTVVTDALQHTGMQHPGGFAIKLFNWSLLKNCWKQRIIALLSEPLVEKLHKYSCIVLEFWQTIT